MENITLGQIATILGFLVGLISSVEFLVARLKKVIEIQLKPLKDELKNERIARLKADLVNYLALAEQELLIGKQKERFYEEYDEYTNKFHQNSFIHSEYERLHKLGKI